MKIVHFIFILFFVGINAINAQDSKNENNSNDEELALKFVVMVTLLGETLTQLMNLIEQFYEKLELI